MIPRRVILYIASSLDGFIADKGGSVTFLDRPTLNTNKGGYSRSNSVPSPSFGPPGYKTIIWGRRTFEQSCELIKNGSQGIQSFPFLHTSDGSLIRNIILSRSIPSVKVLLESYKNVPGLQDAHLEVLQFADRDDTTNMFRSLSDVVWLMGGSETNRFFLRNRMIDELMVTVHPTLLRCGIPLIEIDKECQDPCSLELIDHSIYPDGMVLLHYKLTQ